MALLTAEILASLFLQIDKSETLFPSIYFFLTMGKTANVMINAYLETNLYNYCIFVLFHV